MTTTTESVKKTLDGRISELFAATGLTRKAYDEMRFEVGCVYAEQELTGQASIKKVLRSTQYWAWWNMEFDKCAFAWVILMIDPQPPKGAFSADEAGWLRFMFGMAMDYKGLLQNEDRKKTLSYGICHVAKAVLTR